MTIPWLPYPTPPPRARRQRRRRRPISFLSTRRRRQPSVTSPFVRELPPVTRDPLSLSPADQPPDLPLVLRDALKFETTRPRNRVRAAKRNWRERESPIDVRSDKNCRWGKGDNVSIETPRLRGRLMFRVNFLSILFAGIYSLILDKSIIIIIRLTLHVVFGRSRVLRTSTPHLLHTFLNTE